LFLSLPRVAAGTESQATGPGDDLFASPRVIPLTIEIGDAELKTMLAGSHQYGRCTVRENGVTYAEVGIRYKGNPDKEAASGKPDFTVEFNEFVRGQKFHGLKRVILLAGRDDPSYLSAPIGLELFRNAGIPAARSGFASVQCNGRNLGLYVLVEGVDRDFLKRHFDDHKGNLYDEGKRTDVDGKLEKYGSKNNDNQADVDALAAAARESDPGRRWEQLQRVLDVDRFITFAALEVFLWQKGSYARHARKFRLYHDPVSNRMVFFPKNVEEVLQKTDGPMFPEWKGVVARAVLTTPEGEKRYRATMTRLLDTVIQPGKVQARARELAAIIRPFAAGKEAGAARQFDEAVKQFCEAIASRASFLAKSHAGIDTQDAQ
jgi:hypothetical protein